MSVASRFERQMLDLINNERTTRGLDPLALELRLNDASEDHTRWMDQSGNFSHTGAGGSNPGNRMRDADFVFSGNWTWGENIAYQSERGAPGITDDVIDLHQSLMNSPGHRANILNPDFELIGIGIEEGDGRGFDSVYVTQNFARTSAPVQLDRETPNNPTTGTAGNDNLVGGDGIDKLVGLDGKDTISGGAGNDRLFAGKGEDRISGGDGNDRMNGGNGNDFMTGGNGNDRMNGGADADQMNGDRGHDRMLGGAGNDRMAGDNGSDRLFGGAGNDEIDGGRGNDRLDGGNGNDRLSGKAGSDVFVFSSGQDIVTDFDPAKRGEKIDLSDLAPITDFTDLLNGGHLKQAGSDVIIDDLNGNTLRLLNVAQSDLETNDFLF